MSNLEEDLRHKLEFAKKNKYNLDKTYSKISQIKDL